MVQQSRRALEVAVQGGQVEHAQRPSGPGSWAPCCAATHAHTWRRRLTRELEKKFSDRHVLFIAQRRILGKPSRRSRVQQPRPRSRTLTAVHDSILEDLVFPTEITGKRVRVATDGSKLVKCFLDSKDATSLEYKLDSFSSVYRKLTGKDVTFMFKVSSVKRAEGEAERTAEWQER